MKIGKLMLMTGAAAIAMTGMAAAKAGSAAPRVSDVGQAPLVLAQNDAAPTNAELESRISALEEELQQAEMNQANAINNPPAPPSGWWNNTSISGRMYYDFTNIDNSANGVRVPGGGNGANFDIKRFYVGIDHTFNSVFSANVTTDTTYDSGSSTGQLYLKKAYLQAKIDPLLTIRLGSADLPWVPYVEGLYGYRYLENVMIDRTKFGTSADWGVHIGGTFGDGLVTYAASAINGAGYKTLSRSSDTIDLEGRVSVNPIKNITLGVGAYTGKLGKSADNLPESATPHRATRFNALAAYTGTRIRAGIEYFAAKNWNNVTTVAEDKSDGWSVFGSFAFTPKIGVFGRYDWVKPSRDINPDLKDHYFNLGLNYKPIPPLDLALVYKRDRARHGLISTSNGTIGGVGSGTYDEVGLFGQFAF